MFDEFCQNVKFDFRIYKPNKHKMSLNVKLGGLSRIFTAVENQSSHPYFIKNEKQLMSLGFELKCTSSRPLPDT